MSRSTKSPDDSDDAAAAVAPDQGQDDRKRKTKVGVGVGIGSAALMAALLYANRARRQAPKKKAPAPEIGAEVISPPSKIPADDAG